MGPEDLSQILSSITLPDDDRVLVDFTGADDAAVVRMDDGRLLLQTVDFFTPVVDDPYQFGQIAAANSLSDIYAMGGQPLFALNIVGFPIDTLPREVLTAILQGGIDKASEAGISIVGGHSIDDPEPKYGLVVTGEVAEADLLTNSFARPGDALILTKPLGTGIIATAIKRGVASDAIIAAAVESMRQLNKLAADLAHKYQASAVTDVTGFGLLGHLGEMCQASRVTARIGFSALPILAGASELAEQKILPGGTRRNLAHASGFTSIAADLTEVQRLLAADAQTSGGLLVTLPAEQAEHYCAEYNSQSPVSAVRIGTIESRQSMAIILEA